MKLTCNIDQRGRRVRLINGAAAVGVSGTVMWAGVYLGETWVIVAGVILCFVGAFIFFEGLKGWCAVRAMGIKTPM
jgi:cadmium resistance protein CadD (predicted permease)